MGTCRSVVSKEKIRWREDGFDLDLTYITPRIIAMGFPAEGIESTYRNRMADVQRFFETYHSGFFRIYNLCSERAYSETAFGSPSTVERFPFDDHNPCPLRMIRPFCESVHSFLEADPRNVAAVHCKAGKGRTGMMIAAYLLHSGMCKTADEALRVFGTKRTKNGKGVTIPSQRRYVEYYASLLQQGRESQEIPCPSAQIAQMHMSVCPNSSRRDGSSRSGGCDPYFKVYQYSEEKRCMRCVFNSRKHRSLDAKRLRPGARVDLDVQHLGITVAGDTKIVFYDRNVVTSNDKLCWFWFHSGFVGKDQLVLPRSEVDGACGCKDDSARARFPGNFQLSVSFADESVEPNQLGPSMMGKTFSTTSSNSAIQQFPDASRPDASDGEGALSAQEWLRRIFDLYNVSDDGFIDAGELMQILENASFITVSRAARERIAESIDYEGDGSVSWPDFERLMLRKLEDSDASPAGHEASQLAAIYFRLNTQSAACGSFQRSAAEEDQVVLERCVESTRSTSSSVESEPICSNTSTA